VPCIGRWNWIWFGTGLAEDFFFKTQKGILICEELNLNLYNIKNNSKLYLDQFCVFFLTKNWHKAIPLRNKVRGTLALPFTLNSILRQNKNYENSNISPCKNIIFKKIL
jgi:hypothetical protein